MKRTTQRRTSAVVITALSAAVVFGSTAVYAATPGGHPFAPRVAAVATGSVAGPATSTVLDYRLIQHFGPTITISDSVTMTNTNGTLSGTSYNIQDKCTATITGTLNSGIATFVFRYGAGTCAGRKVTFNGQLGPTAGAGTFITNGGSRGTWNAGDMQLSRP